MELVVKNLPANAGDIRDVGLIPWWGRFPEVENGNPLQCSYLEKSIPLVFVQYTEKISVK